jgi:hypothetical protein
MPVTRFTDEQLMALADGQCPPAEARAIAQAVAADPALKARLAVFEQSRRVLRAAFDATRHEPIPDRLLTVFARAPVAPRRRRFFYPAALAAAVVVGVALSLLYWMPRNVATLLPAPELLAALEITPSGVPFSAAVADARHEIVAVRTLKLQDGSWCREFDFAELADGAVRSRRGVACRESGGSWAMRAVLPAGAVAAGAPDDAYRTASGPDAFASLGPVETLTQAQEAQLLARHWE